MKQFIQFGVGSSLLLSSSAFALIPIEGFYVGVMGEMSHAPNFTLALPSNFAGISGGTIVLSNGGGGGGAQVGYRIKMFRIEGEFLYNRISYDKFRYGPTCTLLSPTIQTPTGYCGGNLSRISFNGSSSMYYGMLNGFYDIFPADTERLLVPYLGVGVGYASFTEMPNFVNNNPAPNNVPPSQGFSINSSSAVLQGILGFSYFMDDYTWGAIDFRYLGTNSMQTFGNTSFGVSSINFVVNFSFDRGGIPSS